MELTTHTILNLEYIVFLTHVQDKNMGNIYVSVVVILCNSLPNVPGMVYMAWHGNPMTETGLHIHVPDYIFQLTEYICAEINYFRQYIAMLLTLQ